MDVPFPADYGGAIDIYYRIQALHELGYKIILHCWEYGRGEQEKLKEITHQVHYYKRKKSIRFALSKLPFIVISRQSKELFNRLLEDNYPILFEGIHTTLLLDNPRLKGRVKIVRMHNVEHDYYTALAEKASGLKKKYYASEAKKLKSYESVLTHANCILAIQELDKQHFETFHSHVKLLSASIPPISIVPVDTEEKYCLFHGNLSVQENDSAVKWILENAFYDGLKLIVAGKNPSSELLHLAKAKGVKVISNPSNDNMKQLISAAHVHLLVTEQSTGIKLKLINSLATGGHVLVNPTMVEGTNLESLCIVFKNETDCKNQLKELMGKPVEVGQLHLRFEALQTQFDTVENCKVFDDVLRK